MVVRPKGGTGLTRRAGLTAGGAAGAGAAGFAVADVVTHRGPGRPVLPRPHTAPYPATTALEFELNTGWRFGRYTAGAERPGFGEHGLDAVTLPHCVTRLSWQKWNPADWEHVWVYRRHIDGAGLPDGRVLVDFDGVMVNATVLLNGHTITSHKGGYLPFTAELTGHLTS